MSAQNTGRKDAKGRTIWRGPRGGQYVLGGTGARLKPAMGRGVGRGVDLATKPTATKPNRGLGRYTYERVAVPPTSARLAREVRELARGARAVFAAVHPMEGIARDALRRVLARHPAHWDPVIARVDGGYEVTGDTRHVRVALFFAPVEDGNGGGRSGGGRSGSSGNGGGSPRRGGGLVPLNAKEKMWPTTGDVDLYLGGDRIETIKFEGVPWNVRASRGVPRTILEEWKRHVGVGRGV